MSDEPKTRICRASIDGINWSRWFVPQDNWSFAGAVDSVEVPQSVADTLTELDASVAALTAALEPFAAVAREPMFPKTSARVVWGFDSTNLTAGDFRAALAAVREGGTDE